MGGAQIGFGEHHDDRSVVLSCAEIHLPHQAAEDPRAVELRARMGRIEGKARHRQTAAARQRLIDRGGEIAVECRRRQQAGPGIEQAAGVDRPERAAQMGLEGVLADQRQGVGGNARRLAGYDFEIGQIVGRRQRIRRHHHRQIAEARILGQHREEGIHHARAKTFAEHDAVDVARVEMFRRGFDARARRRRPSARRATPRARDRRRRGRSGARWRRARDRYRSSGSRAAGSPSSRRITVECSVRTRSAARSRAIRRSKLPPRLRERNGVFGQRCRGIDRDQRQIGLLSRRSVCASASRPGSTASGHRDQNRGRAPVARPRATRRPSRRR